VFHDTLEGQELEESLQASMLAASTAVPGTSAAAAAASEAPAPSSLIAGIVEGLLARLKVSVRRVTLHLQHSQHLSAAAGVQLELRMESFDLQTEASAPAASHPAVLQDRLVQEVVRTARVAGISLWMTLPADAASHEARGTRQARWRAASSSESGSSDSDSETNEYMEMSSAIPDLRQSSIATGALDASQASVYASAEDIRGVEVSQTKSRPDASADTQDVDRGPEMLFSLGSEAIVVRFTTLKEVPRPAPDNFASQNEKPDAGEAQENETVVALPASRLRTSLSVEVGAVVAFVHPRQLAALMSMAGELGSASSPPRDDEQPTSLPAARAAFDASLRIAALHLICAYESPNQLSPPSKRAMHESLQAFWQRPARIHPAVGHLRLRVEGVELDYAVAASSELSPTACVLVTDVGVYEHLSPHLANGDVATVFPILLPDANMQEQYAVPLAGTPLGLEKRREALAPLEQVSMDAADWRLAASEQRSAPSATSEAPRASSQGPYWRASWGERAWKVRPRARRASSSVSSAAKELLRPAVRVNVVLLVTGASTTVELAPLHVFVDVSTVNRLMPLAQSASAALRQNAWSSARSDMSQSFATLTASPKVKSAPLQGASTSTSASRTELRCALLRVELRVPSAAAGPQASELRSGILIVDVQGIDARLGPPSRDVPPHRSSVGFATGPPHTRARPDAVAEDGRCSIAAVVAFFKPIRGACAAALLRRRD
jgi:autophagy-related protein 2